MSDTPKTDYANNHGTVVTMLELSRQLERELAAAQKQCEQEAIHASMLFDENNDLKAKLARYEAAGRELPEGPIGCPTMSKRFIDYVSELRTFAIAQTVRADENERGAKRLRKWLDNNTTFYNVDADWPVEGNNIPTLAQVSNRIWYHATDDETSFPFSKVIDAALKEPKT